MWLRIQILVCVCVGGGVKRQISESYAKYRNARTAIWDTPHLLFVVLDYISNVR